MNQEYKDKLYFKNLLQIVYVDNDSINIVSIITIISLLFYAACYKLSGASLFDFSVLKMFLCILLIVVNTSFYLISTYKHELKEVCRKALSKSVPASTSEIWVDIDKNNIMNDDVTWKMVHFLICLISTIPFAYIALLAAYRLPVQFFATNLAMLFVVVYFSLGVCTFILYHTKFIYHFLRKNLK
jgi:hypothetical protein